MLLLNSNSLFQWQAMHQAAVYYSQKVKNSMGWGFILFQGHGGLLYKYNICCKFLKKCYLLPLYHTRSSKICFCESGGCLL